MDCIYLFLFVIDRHSNVFSVLYLLPSSMLRRHALLLPSSMLHIHALVILQFYIAYCPSFIHCFVILSMFIFIDVKYYTLTEA